MSLLRSLFPCISYSSVEATIYSRAVLAWKASQQSVEVSLEISVVCTLHALLKQNLYGKGKSSEVLAVHRNILDIRPSGFL